MAKTQSNRRNLWPPGISTEARKTLEQLAGTLYAFPFAERLWHRVLTDNERKKLGGDFLTAAQNGRAVGMWMRLHGVNQLRALVEVAYAVEFLKAQKRDWLLRELGAKQQTKTTDNIPDWDKSSGKLRLNGRIIRTVRVMREPTNVQIILDKFQAANWPTSIPSPFIEDDVKRLHDALHVLNTDLKSIRFHSGEGAKIIYWARKSNSE